MIWDTIVAILIIVSLIIAFWAKISNQTVLELMAGIKDLLLDKKEETQEQVEGLVYYE